MSLRGFRTQIILDFTTTHQEVKEVGKYLTNGSLVTDKT